MKKILLLLPLLLSCNKVEDTFVKRYKNVVYEFDVNDMCYYIKESIYNKEVMCVLHYTHAYTISVKSQPYDENYTYILNYLDVYTTTAYLTIFDVVNTNL